MVEIHLRIIACFWNQRTLCYLLPSHTFPSWPQAVLSSLLPPAWGSLQQCPRETVCGFVCYKPSGQPGPQWWVWATTVIFISLCKWWGKKKSTFSWNLIWNFPSCFRKGNNLSWSYCVKYFLLVEIYWFSLKCKTFLPKALQTLKSLSGRSYRLVTCCCAVHIHPHSRN